MTMTGKAGEDDRWQREMRDEFLVRQFYSKAFNYQFFDAESGMVMQKRHVDTAVQWKKDGAIYYIDEKIVRWPVDKQGNIKDRGYDAMFLETTSCSNEGRESKGWMVDSEADWLLYCFAMRPPARGLDCHLVPMQPLKEWFWPREQTFIYHRLEERNRSIGRIVKIRAIHAALKCRQFTIQLMEQEA